MTLKGVILPAPVATRGEERPNPALLQVGNRPILCHALEALRHAGVREVALVIAARELATVQASVAAEGPRELTIDYIPHTDQPAGRAEAFGEALALVGDAACIVHAADGLLAQPLAPLVKLLHTTAAGGAPPDLVMLAHQRADGRSIGLATRRLLRLAGQPPGERELELAGVCLLAPGASRRAAGARWRQGGEPDLTGVAETLCAAGGRLLIERVRGWQRYNGAASDLLELNRFVLEALVNGDDGSGPSPGAGNRWAVASEDSRIEGCVELHPSAHVHASVIVGPAIVGAAASVRDSYIGPYTSIGAGATIEGAEIERSIILPRARIMHIGGRLEGSVVGRDARVFRDFSLPRALRLNVGDGGEVALC